MELFTNYDCMIMKRKAYLLVMMVLLSACCSGYTREDLSYIGKVRAVNMKQRFPLKGEAGITNKIARFLNSQCRLKIKTISSDSIITVPVPETFHWTISKTRDADSFSLKIVCKFIRLPGKRGDLSPKRTAQARFSEKALMYYLLTNNYIIRLINCKSCDELAAPDEIEAED